MQVDTIQIKFITPAETYVVRHPVLRVGKPVESCKLEGDEDPTTFHLGAYMVGQLVGVVSMLIQEYRRTITSKTISCEEWLCWLVSKEEGLGPS